MPRLRPAGCGQVYLGEYGLHPSDRVERLPWEGKLL